MPVKRVYKKFSENFALKSVSIFTAVNFLTKGISFLLLFIYTQPRFISPEENGLLSLFSSSLLFLMPFISLGILFSSSTDIFKMEKKEFNNYFTSSMVLPVAVFLVSSVLFFLFKDFLREHYQFPYSFSLLIPLVTFLVYINDLLIGLFRDKTELRKFAGAGLVKVILEFGLSVVLVVFFAMHWRGRVIGIVVSYSILGIYAFWYFYKCGYLSGRVMKKYLKAEIIYAIPIIIMQVSIFALNTADKFILAKISSSHEEVGIYGVACILGSVIIIFSTAYLTYLFPNIYKTLASANIDYGMIRRKFISYVLMMAAATLLMIVTVPLVYKYFIHQRYGAAVNYFYLMALGYFTWTITYFFYSFLLYYKQKKKILYLSLIIIPIAIATVYAFTSQWGAKGTAAGILVSYLITLVITLFFVKPYLKFLKAK